MFIILLAALGLRLFLAPLGFHIDILSTAGWGQWIYQNGPLGFYENNIWLHAWPTQPPFINLIHGFNNWLYIFLLELFRDTGHTIVKYHLAPGHMLWWFSFTKWFDTARTSGEAAYSIGYLVTTKLFPILADLGIAIAIYKIAEKLQKDRWRFVWPTLYLFSPFTFYLSALWGQYDQLAYLVILITFILESQKRLAWLTPFLFALSIAIKPTGLILVPYFIYLYFKNSHKFISPIISTIFIILFFGITTTVFTNDSLSYFTAHELYPKIFLKSASRLSANAFNFWNIVMTAKNNTQEMRFFLIPAWVWSFISYVTLNIIVFKNTTKVNFKKVIKGLFIIGFGSWLFMTNMLDRYLFAGITSGLIMSIYDKRLLKYWVPLSIIFWINLYNQWWFPETFNQLRNILLWQNNLATKVLSIINIGLFFKIARLVVAPNRRN